MAKCEPNLSKMMWFRALLVGCAAVQSNAFGATGRSTLVASPRYQAKPMALSSPLFSRGGSGSPLGATAVEGEEKWTTPRLHNTPLFRSAALLAAIGLAGYVSAPVGSAAAAAPVVSRLPTGAAAAIHVLSFATGLGTMAYTTFVFGITAFKNLPRKTFGKLQSKLFPKYFNLLAVTSLLQLVTLNNLASVASSKATKALSISFAMILLNLFYLEPTSTKIMFDRYEIEEQEGGMETDKYKKLKASFGKFHGISSLTNLIALCAAVAHGIFLASALA